MCSYSKIKDNFESTSRFQKYGKFPPLLGRKLLGSTEQSRLWKQKTCILLLGKLCAN